MDTDDDGDEREVRMKKSRQVRTGDAIDLTTFWQRGGRPGCASTVDAQNGTDGLAVFQQTVSSPTPCRGAWRFAARCLQRRWGAVA